MFQGFLETHRSEMVESLRELLRIPSVKSAAEPGQPFGAGPSQALQYVLDFARRNGLQVSNLDGYAGHVEFGNGDEYVGVLGHLDVVPAGTGWTHPPFGAELEDGKIYARGAIDDKGPIFGALWSLIMLKELGMNPKRKIRLIFGLDEESDWECVEHYFAKEPAPLGGFTPDADFPMIYAEKGLTTLRAEMAAESESMVPQVIRFEAGHRVNMVPDYAFAEVDCHSETAAQEWETKMFKEARARQIELDVQVQGSLIQLTVHGVSVHGSTPENGVNAICHLASLLGTQSVSNASMWRFIAGIDTEGRSLGIEGEDDITGPLTVNLGLGALNGTTYSFQFNIRFPVDMTLDEILERCRSYISDKWNVESVEYKAPLHLPVDSSVVKVLRKVYDETTGLDSTPLAIGGATYARAIPNCVAFGALFPGREDVAHQSDEYWYVDDYLKCIEIYAHAMYELANTL
ncbi:dipeptidase PepV [Alicyclobacillus sp. SO9]|uniref:dipeptidase PepV n=1 Tax=Alicyclobacillus sp. SO9 TaxID=2665646 RepID=UPI0018E85AA5|nr:dipeptidase PepV [Alicyclobacillus sp. SO9]QQE76837.1 dipeptidase PepV [Alicyclobacillus sp. SO9]